MWRSRTTLPAVLVALGTWVSAVPASALTGQPGGTSAPSAAKSGGSQFGVSVPQGPTLTGLNVPAAASAGAPPRVALRIDEPGVGTVYVRVTVTAVATHQPAVVALLRWVRTGRTITVRWPAGARLTPGTYEVSVRAHDHLRRELQRVGHSSRVAALNVSEPPPAPAPQPTAPPSVSAPEPGVPTPAQSAAAGAVFPVGGPHGFGGPENRFGAPRGSHIHQGQDVLTTEGTPILAPIAGTIISTSYQAGGAGYYAVEHTSVGFDFMFAHCEASTLAVSAEQSVAAGQQLCRAGQTGDATTPHLHFEMWVGGWQSPTGHPVDPLPYLEAWDHTGATG